MILDDIDVLCFKIADPDGPAKTLIFESLHELPSIDERSTFHVLNRSV